MRLTINYTIVAIRSLCDRPRIGGMSTAINGRCGYRYYHGSRSRNATCVGCDSHLCRAVRRHIKQRRKSEERRNKTPVRKLNKSQILYHVTVKRNCTKFRTFVKLPYNKCAATAPVNGGMSTAINGISGYRYYHRGCVRNATCEGRSPDYAGLCAAIFNSGAFLFNIRYWVGGWAYNTKKPPIYWAASLFKMVLLRHLYLSHR